MKIEMELHDVHQELPETSGKYVGFFDSGAIMDVNFSIKHNKFNTRDYCEDIQDALYPEYWTEIPNELVKKLDLIWEEKHNDNI